MPPAISSEDQRALRTTFDESPELQERARAIARDELFDDLIALGRLAPGACLVEIGCGTGQATLPLAERGFEIVGIELGAWSSDVNSWRKKTLMSQISDDIRQLRFQPGPIQSLYLNADRVNERFVSHLGAVNRWTRSAQRGGGAGIGLTIVNANEQVGREDALEYGIDDPVVRALLLREALIAADEIRPVEATNVGQYAVVTGRACLPSRT